MVISNFGSMNNYPYNEDQKSAASKQNHASSAASNEGAAAAAAFMSYNNRGIPNNMQTSTNNLAFYDPSHRQSLPSVLNGDALMRNMGINGSDSGRLDAASTTDLIRKKLMLEEQVRLELLSRLASLENQNNLLMNPAQANMLFNNVEDKLHGAADSKRRYSDTSVGQQKRFKTDKSSYIQTSGLAEYPLPPLSDKKMAPSVGRLTSFRKTWKRLERMSDMMDDTPADQEAFVSELFSRKLNATVSDHLRERMAKLIAEKEKKKSYFSSV